MRWRSTGEPPGAMTRRRRGGPVVTTSGGGVRAALRTGAPPAVLDTLNRRECRTLDRAFYRRETALSHMEGRGCPSPYLLGAWIDHPDEAVVTEAIDRFSEDIRVGRDLLPRLLDRIRRDAEAEGLWWTPVADALDRSGMARRPNYMTTLPPELVEDFLKAGKERRAAMKGERAAAVLNALLGPTVRRALAAEVEDLRGEFFEACLADPELWPDLARNPGLTDALRDRMARTVAATCWGCDAEPPRDAGVVLDILAERGWRPEPERRAQLFDALAEAGRERGWLASALAWNEDLTRAEYESLLPIMMEEMFRGVGRLLRQDVARPAEWDAFLTGKNDHFRAKDIAETVPLPAPLMDRLAASDASGGLAHLLIDHPSLTTTARKAVLRRAWSEEVFLSAIAQGVCEDPEGLAVVMEHAPEELLCELLDTDADRRAAWFEALGARFPAVLMERLQRNRVPDLEGLPKEAWSGLLMSGNAEIRLQAIARLSGKKPPPKKRRRRGR